MFVSMYWCPWVHIAFVLVEGKNSFSNQNQKQKHNKMASKNFIQCVISQDTINHITMLQLPELHRRYSAKEKLPRHLGPRLRDRPKLLRCCQENATCRLPGTARFFLAQAAIVWLNGKKIWAENKKET